MTELEQREFFRFPHTPHLAWLGPGEPRGDKVLDPRAAQELLAAEVCVEEKVDGANVGIGVDAQGRLRAQNRGQYLRPGAHAQFGLLWPWIDSRADRLRTELGSRLILFGEWCFAVHSIRYAQLPDWLLGFDVYDLEQQCFWSSERRDELLARVDAVPVPRLAYGRMTLAELRRLLERAPSRVGGETLEGLVIRSEAEGRLLARAKLVRPGFVQQIDEHWSRRPLQPNQRSAGPDSAKPTS